MNKNWIIMIFCFVIVIGVIGGTIMFNCSDNNQNIVEQELNEISEEILDECTEEWGTLQKESKIELETNSNEEKISPNCKLVLRRFYSECGHTINEYLDIPQQLVNKTEEDLKKEYPYWNIEKYSSFEMILYKQFDSSCGQHFVLRSVEGKIVVYIINENMEEEVFEKTEISIDYLTDTDKVEIEKGIKVYGKEELNQLLEDFE